MLKASFLDAEMAWLDTGTFDSLYDASSLIKALQNRSGSLIGSPELTAYENKWLTKNELKTQLNENNPYGKSLLKSLDR
jgi:glucose-1-phosphate thymidylyltransferase